MALLKNNKQPAKPERLDWHDHQGFNDAQRAHAEQRAKLPGLRDRVHPDMALHQAVKEAERATIRGEMELLAGRKTEAEVAALRSAEIAAKRALAIAQIELEDAEADEVNLAAQVVRQRKAAKEAAADSIRARYRDALVEVRDSLLRSVAADQVLHQVLNDLDRQFPGARLPNGNLTPDEDDMDRHLRLRHVFSGGERIPELLKQIDQALAAMEALG